MAQDSTPLKSGMVVSTPAVVNYLEISRCSAKWGDSEHTSVDLTAEGFIRNPYRGVRLTSQGWQNIQADGDDAPRPSLVIFVEEVPSAYPGNVPRGFFTLDNFVVPHQLSNPSNLSPEIVFCGLEPGTGLNSAPSGGMRRTRLRL